MGVLPKPDHHVCRYDQRSYSAVSNDNGIRYFLFRKCSCGSKYAYDLVSEKPQAVLTKA